ncbi:predicted protein [Naegleria gruberi]|uniref:Predicted protein n=1 Tax=Naegleria gruberi TaxID=5762 RepID=D2UYW3_NAEGR|nr:uncharacterized protein NAEGRDRAFT_60179 [Naegleria gruberi]EFC50041.1 predicted protein [Naegleria gruberi]|eukprot:XP_002682785.1 predicted protein [Naegleria gruberi strain NEG-M]
MPKQQRERKHTSSSNSTPSGAADKVSKEAKTLQAKKYVEKESKRRLIVVLENCPLEVGKIGEKYKLLNSDDHRTYLSKHGKNPDDYRPDVVHQCLLSLFDSPISKAGLLQVYMHTADNTLIEVNPHTRVPRTYKRFAGLMVQLLFKHKIKASETEAVLFKVIKNPITEHLPSTALKVAAEYNQETVVRLEEYVPVLYGPMVFVIGAFARGDLKVDYVDEYVSISSYPLSGAMVCMKVCCAFEEHWQVL